MATASPSWPRGCVESRSRTLPAPADFAIPTGTRKASQSGRTGSVGCRARDVTRQLTPGFARASPTCRVPRPRPFPKMKRMTRRSRRREVALQLLFWRDVNPTALGREAVERFVRERFSPRRPRAVLPGALRRRDRTKAPPWTSNCRPPRRTGGSVAWLPWTAMSCGSGPMSYCMARRPRRRWRSTRR